MTTSTRIDQSVEQLTNWLTNHGSSLFTNDKQLNKVLKLAKVTQERVAGLNLGSTQSPSTGQ